MVKRVTRAFLPKPYRFSTAALGIIAVALVAFGGLVVLITRADGICDINPASNNAAFDAAIAGCADGSTIRFPLNASYTLSDRILVKDRHNLVIDGNGSTFMSTRPNIGTKVAGNWVLQRGVNIHIKNMKIIGNFHLEGTRSQQRVNEEEARSFTASGTTPPPAGYTGNQTNMGVGIYGGDTIYVTDMTIEHVFGDGVANGVAHYLGDGSQTDPLDTSRNTHIERVHASKTARHCYSPSIASTYWLIDSSGDDCWYGGMDLELDNVTQKLDDVHLLRNKFSDYLMFGISFPVAGNGDNTINLEIKNNIFLTGPDNYCNAIINAGNYPIINVVKNVVVDNNTFAKRSGRAVNFGYVNGGSVQNNKDSQYVEAGCTYPAVQPFYGSTGGTYPDDHENVALNITVANNGPDAPGANGSTSPTPTTSPASPSTSPSPTPSSSPPISNCPAPTNFAGTPGPAGSGRYDFTWTGSSGATENFLYLGIAPDQPNTKYNGPYASTSGSAYSLTTGRPYTFAVRATCGSVVSPNSNVLTVVAPGSTGASPSPTPTVTPTPNKPGDVNGDGKVDVYDLSILASSYGLNGVVRAHGDLNNDGVVNVYDLSILASNWGI